MKKLFLGLLLVGGSISASNQTDQQYYQAVMNVITPWQSKVCSVNDQLSIALCKNIKTAISSSAQSLVNSGDYGVAAGYLSGFRDGTNTSFGIFSLATTPTSTLSVKKLGALPKAK